MEKEFIGRPPLPLGRGSGGSFLKQIWRLCVGFKDFLWIAIIPFNPRPEEILEPPQVRSDDVDDKQLEQCQRIFDDVESSRVQLEQKARATFTLIAFLVPLLASIFVFLLEQTSLNSNEYKVSVILLLVSSVLLVFGFISIVRAISLKTVEKPFLQSVFDFEKKEFRKYNKAVHARGLLYCASMNQGMNDHISQFVKGAHILSACSIIMFAAGAVSIALAHQPKASSSLTKIEVIGLIAPLTSDLIELRNEMETLNKSNKMLTLNRALEKKIDGIEAKLKDLETSPIHQNIK